MSLILEALRKSETERRRGQAPDLYAELPPHAPHRPRTPPAWTWIVATIAILLAVAWRLFDDRPMRNAEVVDEPSISSASPVEAPEPAVDFPRISRIAPPPTPATPPPASEADTTATNPTPPASGAREVVDAAGSMDVPIPTTPPIVPPISATPTAETLKLSELSVEERKQLPAMKLSMHLWNERPEQRFVIFDGNRYAQGDRIGAAVITAIQADGVLLELNGRAVQVPLR